MTVLSALSLATSGLVIVRAVAANNRLAAMRSEFVAGVTHELKTPIATIRAISQTLAAPGPTPEMIQEFAQVTLHEASRLTRLIDNLLSYSRITDVTEIYTFEPIHPAALVADVMKEFSIQTQEAKATVTLDVPRELPSVLVDRTAAHLMLGNLIDNALRF